ncbi:hypothetical protein [Psychrobacter sp. DAB_AL32B]|uniref:hypothetical protein n=1 Tax=Psychrobacter sp. DAB_AL32B TaxID=1028414 RepID=UPI000B7F5DE0|nr:hypothetical protein [Psychrobacter sp. DAB_AL32B]OXL23337.1 hypothetical protein CAN34_07380 [Psychrobacter sp. DAB_AL32B]
MNKLIMTPIALSLLTFMLIGCGEGEDAIFGSGSSNEITVSSFEGNSNNIVRINEKYRTGEHNSEAINIVGNYNSQGINTLDKTVLLNSFEGTLENRYIEVNGLTVKRPIYLKNSNTVLDYRITYNEINLSGLKADSYKAGNDINSSSGIRTALNTYSKISANNANTAFPKGSICYIPVTTSEREFLAFNAKNETNYRTLNDWLNVAKNRFNDSRPSQIKEGFGVGTSNRQTASQVKFFATNDDPEYIYSAVVYAYSNSSNRIYETDYVASGTTGPNASERNGLVDCTLYNKVAADFLAKEIADSYRK